MNKETQNFITKTKPYFLYYQVHLGFIALLWVLGRAGVVNWHMDLAHGITMNVWILIATFIVLSIIVPFTIFSKYMSFSDIHLLTKAEIYSHEVLGVKRMILMRKLTAFKAGVILLICIIAFPIAIIESFEDFLDPGAAIEFDSFVILFISPMFLHLSGYVFMALLLEEKG